MVPERVRQLKRLLGNLPFSGRVEVEKLSILENQRGYRQSIGGHSRKSSSL